MTPEIKTIRYFTCPNGCAHQFSVEHLFAALAPEPGRTRMAGPWHCDDCGQGWRITYDATSLVDVSPAGDCKRTHWVTLELPPQSSPVRFRVRGVRFTESIDVESERYFYEEHTCPTNWLRNVDRVEIDGEEDPHGLWVLREIDGVVVADE